MECKLRILQLVTFPAIGDHATILAELNQSSHDILSWWPLLSLVDSLVTISLDHRCSGPEHVGVCAHMFWRMHLLACMCTCTCACVNTCACEHIIYIYIYACVCINKQMIQTLLD